MKSKVIYILLFLFHFFNSQENFSQTMRTIDSLLQVLEKINADTAKVKMMNNISWEYRTVNPLKSLEYARQALQLAQKINFKKGQASSYNSIGATNWQQGDYVSALNNYIKSVKIREELGDKNGIAASYSNIGSIYYSQGNNTLALENYFKSLKIKEEIKDSSGMAHSYVKIGAVYHEQKNYSKALDNFSAALKIFETVNDKAGIDMSYGNMGVVYKEQGNFSLALEYQLKALMIRKELGDKNTLSDSYINIGDLYEEQNKHADAIKYFNKALDIDKEIGDQDGMKHVYDGLSISYAKQNDFKSAYEYHKKYSDVKDSMLNEESSKQIAEMQTKYETEKKEQQIILLNKDKELQDAQLNRQKIVIWSVAGGFLIVLILSIFIFRERKKSEKLLLNILPAETAKELKSKGKASPKYYESVTVMFTDFKGFTTIAEKLSVEELVSELDFLFKKFDEIISKYNIEKIKTIGDAYMCVSGLPTPNANHAEEIVKAGLEIQNWMIEQNGKWKLRIGIHSGSVTAGVVGDKKFAYDIWGDTVNVASRMESSGEAGKINISGATYELVKNSPLTKGDKGGCQFTHRGKIPAKNKGEIEMYFVQRTPYGVERI